MGKNNNSNNNQANNQNKNQNNGGNPNQNQKQNQQNQQKQPKQNQQQNKNRNNNNKKNNNMPIKDEFELREKRLKLVYRILYVAAILWVAIIYTMTKTIITVDVASFYVFLLSASSVFIIRIVKYALAELRCMKISEQNSDTVKNEAETRYNYIWSLFGLSLVVHAMLLLINITLKQVFTTRILLIVFAVCGVILLLFNIVDLVFALKKKDVSHKYRIFSDIVEAVLVNITAYSICSIFIAVVTSNA